MQTEGAPSMTATSQPESKSPSRRALLAGALGGLGAWAASAIGRISTVRAEGEAIVVGGDYIDATGTTYIENSANTATVLWGTSISGTGVRGQSSSNYGVIGTAGSGTGVSGGSTSGVGVRGQSSSNVAVYGNSYASDQPASLGLSLGNSTGVQGASGSLPVPKPNTGIYGYANQDSSAKGIWGQSPNGRGVMGSSSTGWAGYFSGRVYTERYHELKEITNPSAPGSNKLRLFARDNGSGKTQLCVRFPTGAVQVIKTEP
jgi:hypothetical protein